MNGQGLLGIGAFIVLAYLFSENRKAIDWKIVIWGVAMQFVIAGIILGSHWISLTCLFIYILAIVIYNIGKLGYSKIPPILQIGLGLVIAVGLSFMFSLLGDSSVFMRDIIWYFFLAIGSIRVIFEDKPIIRLPKAWSNMAGILLCTSIFGTLWATNTTGADLFKGIGDGLTELLSYARAGGIFLFGSLYTGEVGWIFAIDVTVSIIFFTALVSILDSVGLMNQTISSIASFINWNMMSLGIKPLSGAETLVSIGSIPLGGQNLLFVKSYLDRLTNSEITVMLTSVMATISASLFAAFISIGISATHLLAASAMSVPAVIALSKILVPEMDKPITQGEHIEIIKGPDYGKPLAATMTGISEGIQISLFMGGALIVFISLIAMFDGALLKLDAFVDGELLASIFNQEKNSFGEYKGIVPGSVKTIFGYLFAPLAFVMGTPPEDMLKIGYLMGTKISVNEFVAFAQLGEFIKNMELSEISIIIASFALCGYANPGTVAIALGTVSPYVKNKKEIYARYGFISLFLGAGASWMTAAIASLFANII
ncbi:MAG: nucleoside transporter C-terminal domain-containing protein [Brevinema sp.]